MFRPHFWRFVMAVSLLAGAAPIVLPAGARADEPDKRIVANAARMHWESIVIWFMEEESGESSLRIRDQDVRDRGWFKFLELWHFDHHEGRWVQLNAEKFEKAIVLPKQKGSDQPEGSQTLVDMKEMEPKTAGLWFAKWVIDDVPCSTYMKVGGARARNELELKSPGRGMIRAVVPIDLDHSEHMYIPDPHIFCVAGGPGKPEAGDKSGK